MPQVITNPTKKLQRGQWPQDTLNPPTLSGMPPVAKSNLAVKREAYVISAKFLNQGYGQNIAAVQVPASGDFWCRSISAFCPNGNLGLSPFVPNFMPYAQIQITDLRTGYNFFNPYILFSQLVGTGGALTQVGLTATATNSVYWNAHAATAMPHLYCFTRNTSIQITLSRPPNAVLTGADNLDFWFMFSGWLEYQNASG